MKERVKRGGCIRDRQRGEMRVFSFHYIGSLKRIEGGVGGLEGREEEEKNVLVRAGVSGGAARRAGAIRRHSADKYGSPQKWSSSGLKTMAYE